VLLFCEAGGGGWETCRTGSTNGGREGEVWKMRFGDAEGRLCRTKTVGWGNGMGKNTPEKEFNSHGKSVL
jgi:hypothetical protein